MALTDRTTQWVNTSIPDPAAASEVVGVLNAASSLSAAEAGVLDGVTAGTAAASKALVLDSSSNIATINSATVTTLVNTAINAAAAAATLTVKANTAAAYSVTDATTSLYVQDTRNTVTVQNHKFDMPAAQTLPNGATSRYRGVSIAAHTVTLLGTTQVTTANQGVGLHVGAQTIAQSGGAVTVDQASALHIDAVVAGSSVTITANRLISTSVSDCYCTAAGVWTDTASFADGKNAIEDAPKSVIMNVLDKINPKSWFYKPEVHGNDYGRQRAGVLYDELPEELRAPGGKTAVSTGVLASFSLAALKVLHDRLAKLEAAAA